MIVEKFSPALYGALGIFLPLIAVNCSILGGALFMQERQYSTFMDVTAFSMGSGIGWAIAIVLIAGIREKIRYSHIPAPLKGLGITFILTGLMGIAFMSFSGIKYVDEPKKEKKEATTETASNKVAELSTSNKHAK
jgi:Na+-transporting NADH:ubiquinone oxidoreductase subunit E